MIDSLASHGLAVPARDLDAVFDPEPRGWLGMDGGSSVVLPDGRLLWLFGDTLVGEMKDGRRSWSRMPRNSIALMTLDDQRRPVALERLDRPDRATGEGAFFLVEGQEDSSWFWVGTAFLSRGRLFVMGYRVTDAPPGSNVEALNFDVAETWIIVVENPLDHPLQWRQRGFPARFPQPATFFCTASIEREGWRHLLGLQHRHDGEFRSARTVMARIREDRLHETDGREGHEFLLEGEGGGTSWGTAPGPLAGLHEPAVTEADLFHDAPRGRFLATCYLAHTPEFLVTTAPDPAGPWAKPRVVHVDPHHAARPELLSYTLRMHPGLARDQDEMVLSYCVNTPAASDLARDTHLYRLRFLRLDLKSF